MRRLTLTLLLLSLASPAFAGIFRRRARPVYAAPACASCPQLAPQYAPKASPNPMGMHPEYRKVGCEQAGGCKVVKVWVAQ